jgi:prepilin-type N-terminal cleavage/methylation domain-containing protein
MVTHAKPGLRADNPATFQMGDMSRQPGMGSVSDRLVDLRAGLGSEASVSPRGGLVNQHLGDLGKLDGGGFTLIELLIVIVVLGILAAVVIFALGGITNKSAVAACQADGATVATAISAFNAQNPGVLASSATAASDEGLLLNTTSSLYGGPYISSWPSNQSHYAYALVSGTLLLEVPGPSTGAWAPTAAVTYSAPGAGTSAWIPYNNQAGTSSVNGNGVAFNGPTSCLGV